MTAATPSGDERAGAAPPAVADLLLDWLLPVFDANRIELRVIDGGPDEVYEATWQTDVIIEFVMGMNRWCYRVGADAALMTDALPALPHGRGRPGAGARRRRVRRR